MKMQTITTTMRIIEVKIETADPTGANIVVENHIEVLNKGEGDNKIIIEANTKATMDNLIPPVIAIIIIIMAIIKAEVAVAVVVTIIDHTITEVGNYRDHNNYQYHQYYMHDDGSQFKQYGPPCTLCRGFSHSPKHCFKGEHDINNLMEKMNLGSSNQHQNGLYQ